MEKGESQWAIWSEIMGDFFPKRKMNKLGKDYDIYGTLNSKVAKKRVYQCLACVGGKLSQEGGW